MKKIRLFITSLIFPVNGNVIINEHQILHFLLKNY